MAVIDASDRVTFTAPAPDAVATATVQTMGPAGPATRYYWIVANFPIGVVVSNPFTSWSAPSSLTATNYVQLVWTPVVGATSYDILRTDTPELPDAPGTYALAQAVTATEF